jgi:hypothetical protein
MTEPIAQTFYINEPVGGVEGVVLTSVDIYFQSVSPTYGVELRICTTQNGQPTAYMLPEASKILQVTDNYGNGAPIIRSSKNASVPTKFTFDSPITLQSQTSYALVIVPLGGNPDYTVWTGSIGGSDVLTSTPIYQSATAYGSLYLSTNDIDFTAVQSEAIKYTLYTANFSASGGSGTAVYNIANAEQIAITSMTGNFLSNEKIFVTNAIYNRASLTISSNTGAFTAGEIVYQSNGTVNVATGNLVYANSSTLLVHYSNGTWVTSSSNNTFNIKGVTSAANGVVSVVSQNTATYSNTVITVPYTSNGSANVFYANQTIYIATSGASNSNIRVVTGTINSTAISVDSNVSFSDTNAILGHVRGDSYGLFGYYTGSTQQFSSPRAIDLIFSTANGSVNFYNTIGQYVVGKNSGTSAKVSYSSSAPYQAIIPQISSTNALTTNISFSLKGISTSNVYDTSSVALSNYTVTEFTDTSRAIKGKSVENVLYSGNSTLTITSSLSTSNNKISPYIDSIQNAITTTQNLLFNTNNISGYLFTYSNTNNIISKNDNISQSGGATAKVYHVDKNYIYVNNVNGTFVSGATIYVSSNTVKNTYVNSVTEINEKYSANVMPGQSRYISKSVTLATGQDAEDLVVYLGAYRPAGANLQVYGQLLNKNDQDNLTNKVYSRLVEQPVSTALVSSSTNTNDIVELVYGLPQSQLLYSNAVTCNAASANVVLNSPYTVGSFSNGQYIYLSNKNTGTFNVRQIVGINLSSNSTLLTLNTPPSVVGNSTSSVYYADIGIIPGLEHTSGAFAYTNNLGIVRYVSNTDIVYDTYLTFAIKIVPTSNAPHIVPRVTDMRALALQV